MAARTGKTKAEIAAEIKKVQGDDKKTAPNPIEASMEAYLDSGCQVQFMIPKSIIDAFKITHTVDDGVPVYGPKPTKESKTKRADKGINGKGTSLKAGRVFGRTCRAGKLVKCHLATPITRARAGKNLTVRKLYMRVPSVMDNASILYFVQKSFGTQPAAVTIGSKTFFPDDWKDVDKAKLGTKYSSKPWVSAG